MTTPGRLTRAVPVLAALDLDRQVAFYRDKLGFAAARVYADFRYAILERDDVELEPKPWGMTEFEVIDPDGNLLRFGESR